MLENKKILDACCGSKMFWFDKENPNVLFQDIREENHTLCDGRTLTIKPDVIADFTNMPYEAETFYHIVWDPPHMNKLGKNSWMAKKYGVLLPTWETDLKSGFEECMRVLKHNGTLVFKWNVHQIKLNDVLKIFPQKPLYGHTSGKHGKTIWLCFMKLN
jgi:SAM-dependent methyltransferase